MPTGNATILSLCVAIVRTTCKCVAIMTTDFNNLLCYTATSLVPIYGSSILLDSELVKIGYQKIRNSCGRK